MKKSTLLATSAIVIGLITGAASADTIRFWTTEHQPPRLAKQQQMAENRKKVACVNWDIHTSRTVLNVPSKTNNKEANQTKRYQR